MKKVFAIVLAASALTVALAQGFSPDDEKDAISYDQLDAKFGPVPAPAAELRVGAVMKALSNEYWQLLKKGYEKQASKYGITVDAQAPNNESDQLAQLSMMNTMLSKGYEIFLVSPQSDSNLLPGVEKAMTDGKQVLNVNDALVANAPNYVGNVQRDNGAGVAKWMIKNTKGGSVAIIEGQAGVYAARQRTAGFKETITKDARFKVVSSVPGDWDRQKAFNAARDILRKNPNLLAFYCNNDTMALGVVEAVRSGKRLGKTQVFGTDGIKAAYESIKKGELTGTVDSFPIWTGQVALEVALRLHGGQKLPRVVQTPQAVVTKFNVGTYEAIAQNGK
jgi:ribose transport system substrate-binding protein